MAEAKTPKKRAKRKAPEGIPRLLTHRQVAELFQVTPAGLRRWVAKGEFPRPHSIICQTWFYREDMIAHRIKTGEWPEDAEFMD
jgi:hypothetical protein